MKLMELPLIMEGFYQIYADGGPRGPWYINRWAEVPGEWCAEFRIVEKALAKAAGRTLYSIFGGADEQRPEWLGEGKEFDPNDIALIAIYNSANDSPGDILRALDVCEADIELVQTLFDDWFDGDLDSRTRRMHKLFITREYSV